MSNELMTTSELVEAYRKGVHGVFSVSVRKRRSDMLPVTYTTLVTLFMALWAF
jgi:hypothetical protein